MSNPIDRNDMVFLECQEFGEKVPPIVIYRDKDNTWWLRIIHVRFD